MLTNELTTYPYHEGYTDSYSENYTENAIRKKIGLAAQSGISFVYLSDIICCKAEGNYCMVYLKSDNKVEIISKTLKEFEISLSPYNFFRIHRSYLINLEHIREYLRYNNNSDGDGGVVIMDNDLNIPVSRDKKRHLLDRISHPF